MGMTTLLETNCLHLKMDVVWKMIVSFWGKRPIFRGYVSFRECKIGYKLVTGVKKP